MPLPSSPLPAPRRSKASEKKTPRGEEKAAGGFHHPVPRPCGYRCVADPARLAPVLPFPWSGTICVGIVDTSQVSFGDQNETDH